MLVIYLKTWKINLCRSLKLNSRRKEGFWLNSYFFNYFYGSLRTFSLFFDNFFLNLILTWKCIPNCVCYWKMARNNQLISCREKSSMIGCFNNRSSFPRVFCKNGVLRNFAKFIGKQLQPANLSKKRLWYRCPSVNFVKLLRKPFFIEHFRWLLL